MRCENGDSSEGREAEARKGRSRRNVVTWVVGTAGLKSGRDAADGVSCAVAEADVR